MFRRRKSAPDSDEAYLAEGEEYPEAYQDADYQDEAGQADEADQTVRGPQPRADGGPWDATEAYPERDRVDLGSLLVPVGPEHEIQLVMAEQHGAWVTVRYGGSELQVQAFAAPRSGSLWDDIRAEIATEVQTAGGASTESAGTFGVALDADVPADPAQPAAGLRRVRFIGVDGPRWFLRGLLSGPAAEGGTVDAMETAPLESVFRDIVVVRGEHPVPPRDLLELRLPPDAQQAIADQMAAQEAEEQNPYAEIPDPFERGPEFTETR